MTLSDRDILIYAAIGFGVWLNGALTFYLTGGAVFESGPWIAALAALFIAIAVCWIFRSTMRWRKTDARQSIVVAVTMGLPGLFGEAVRELFFAAATGLKPQTQPVFAATMFFGNGALLAYAVYRTRAART